MSILDTRSMDTAFTGVFVQTNEEGTNRVLAFRRDAHGALEQAGEYPTGGAGLGAAHLGSQGSVILTADGRFLLVTQLCEGQRVTVLQLPAIASLVERRQSASTRHATEPTPIP